MASWQQLEAYSYRYFTEVASGLWIANTQVNDIAVDFPQANPVPHPGISAAQRWVLGYGLKFVPPTTTQPTTAKQESEVWRLGRQLLWRLHFGWTATTPVPPLYQQRQQNGSRADFDKAFASTVAARRGDGAALAETLRRVKHVTYSVVQLMNSASTTPMPPSPQARLFSGVLTTLLQRHDIVITPADKNLGLCVAPTALYCLQYAQELRNTQVYERARFDWAAVIRVVEWCASHLMVVLRHTGMEHKYGHLADFINDGLQRLSDSKCKTAIRPYLLWKIHKMPKLAIRPITPAHRYPTAVLSRIVDVWLQPVMRSSRGYIRDTGHYQAKLHALSQSVTHWDDVYLITGDIVSLYPNVPTDGHAIHSVVAYAAAYYIRNGYDEAEVDAMGEIITAMLHTIFNNHYVEAPTGQTYRQISGLAMGTQTAPSFATVWLATLEASLLDACGLTIIDWSRYLDDISSLVRGSPAAIRDFCNRYDGLTPTIKVDAWHVGKEGVFLDLRVNITSAGPTWEVFQKPTHKGLYLPMPSAHLPATFKAWVTAEFMRLMVRTKDAHRQRWWCDQFEARLLDRGYSYEDVRRWRQDACDRAPAQLARLLRTPTPHIFNRLLNPTLVVPTPHGEEYTYSIALVTRYNTKENGLFATSVQRHFVTAVHAWWRWLAGIDPTVRHLRIIRAFTLAPSLGKQLLPLRRTHVTADTLAALLRAAGAIPH